MKKWHLIFLLLLAVFTVCTVSLAEDTLSVQIHNYRSEPFTDRVGQAVELFLSVADADGMPVTDLTKENFRLEENYETREITLVSPARDEPVRLLFMLDNSQSIGGYLPDIGKTAADFVNGLGTMDEIAVMQFNESFSLVQNFTLNHGLAAEKLQEVSSELRTGSCTYDAAYEALTLLSANDPGRRVLILFTDGKDERFTDSQPCSRHTREEVEKLAIAEDIPLYILAFGNKTDPITLQSLADNTGGNVISMAGLYDTAPGFEKLNNILRSEYRISYASSGTGGGRNILIEAEKDGASGLAKRLIQLQETPVIMSFETPSEGEELTGMVKLSVSFAMLNERIAGVKYSLNGEVFGESVNHPYVYNWDAGKSGPAENALLEAVCFDKNGAELARTSVTVNITEAPVTKLIFTSPQENGEYQGSLPLEIAVDGNKDEIAKINFYANGKEIGHVVTEPFSYTWDITDRQAEAVEIIAIAYNRENGEIDRSSLNVNILPTVIENNGEIVKKSNHTLLFVIIGAVLAAAAAAVFLLRRKNRGTNANPQIKQHIDTPPGAGETVFNARIPMNKTEESGFQITLEITGCEDSGMIGRVFTTSRLPVTLGRNPDNDLVLSEKEVSVSRYHAQISEIDGEIHIQDSGSKYGTFVNNRNILNAPHPLKNDDMIKLGRSVRIKYRNSAEDSKGKAAETYVGFHLPNATLVADTERSKILK